MFGHGYLEVKTCVLYLYKARVVGMFGRGYLEVKTCVLCL